MPRIALLPALALLAVLSSGCSAEHYYNRGQDALARRDFAKAIAEFNKAAGKEPDNPLYAQAADRARQQGADYYLDQALLHSRANELTAATSDVETSLRFVPDQPAALELREDLRSRMALAEQLRADAFRLADQGLFDQAIDSLQRAIERNRNLSGAQRDLARLRQQAAEHWLAQARARMARGELDHAADAAQQALRYDAGNTAARQLLTEVANRRQADQLVAQARGDLQQQRYDAALAALQQAARLYPNHPDLPALLLQARQAVADQHLARGRQLLDQQEFAAAIEQFQQARTLLPDYGQVDRLIAQAQRELAGRNRRRADQAFAQQRWGEALLQYLQADAIAPRSVPRETIQTCIDRIRQRIETRLGVAVGADRRRFDLRQAIESAEPAIVAHLAAVRPDPVAVLSPPQFQRAMAGRNMLPGDLFGPGGNVALGRLAGEVDYVLLVRLGEVRIDDRREPAAPGRWRSQSGTRAVNNPAYDAAAAERDQAAALLSQRTNELNQLQRREREIEKQPPSPARNRRLADVRREIEQTQRQVERARISLDAAERNLRQIPRRIQEPVFEERTFPVFLHTRTATLPVQVQLVETATRQAVLDESFDVAVSATDQTADPPRETRLPRDPLQLPSEAELTTRLIAQAVQAINANGEQALYRVGERHLAQAQAALRNNQPVAAVEHFVDYLFARPTASPPVEQAYDAVTRRIAVDPSVDLRQLLRNRAQILQPPVRLPVELQERDASLWITRFTAAAPAGVHPPVQVTAVAGRPVLTIAALDYIVNRAMAGDRLAVDFRDRDQVRRTFLVVERASP